MEQIIEHGKTAKPRVTLVTTKYNTIASAGVSGPLTYLVQRADGAWHCEDHAPCVAYFCRTSLLRTADAPGPPGSAAG